MLYILEYYVHTGVKTIQESTRMHEITQISLEIFYIFHKNFVQWYNS